MTKLRIRHCLVAWVIIGLGFVLPISQRIGDPDIWWHIKTGELIWARKAVPVSDPFSFACLGHHWTAHEWLSELIFFGTYSHSGFIGIMLLEAILLTLMFSGIYALVRRGLGNQTAALGITSLCGLAGWQLWGPRPQLFTYVLLTGLLLILGKQPANRIRWLMVPMFCLWSNLHGAWLFGFALVAVVLAEEIVASMRAGRAADARQGGLIFACSLLAALIGPGPLERLVYPFQYFTGSIPVEYVTEFKSPNFREIASLPYEALLFTIAILLYTGRKQMRPSEWILLGSTTHLSFLSVRHVPLFAIVAAPVLALQFQGTLDRYAGYLRARKRSGEIGESPVLNLLLLLMLPALVLLKLPGGNDEAHCVVRNAYPLRAAQYLGAEPRIGSGRLLNGYNWGGYLIFHLYPKYLVTVDGRADIHRKHMVRELRALGKLSPGWRREIDRINPDVILWSANEPLSVILRRDPGWRVLHQDRTAVVFARNSPPR